MSTKTSSSSAAGPARTHRDPGSGRLRRTKNDLPLQTRVRVVELLNQRLADCVDLQMQAKQAHWNVRGPSFIALHKLFDEIYVAVETYVDLIAERVVQLGGVTEGTVRGVAARTTLPAYPPAIESGDDHVDALSSALAAFGKSARLGIDEMEELDDAVSMDVLTEITRGVDQWLWFVEAHHGKS